MMQSKIKIVLASTNPSKLMEIQTLLRELPIDLIPQSQLAIPDVEETGTTFIENAIIKARHAARYSGLPAISDDSGLAITALGGAPGVFSSRYAGPAANSQDRINKVLAELQKTQDPDRSACFHCVIALMEREMDPAPLICHGLWHGEILSAPRGTKGFGYDPIFYVPDHRCSVAELDETVKNAISHRGQAIQQLHRALAESLR